MRFRPRRLFYGWWMALGGAMWSAVIGGIYAYGFGAFFTPLITEFGWSRAGLSGALSLSRLEGGTVAPLSGILIDRFGPRRLMLVGVAVMGAGFILLSRINSLVAFYLVFVLVVSLGSSFGTVQGINTAIGNWFVRRRGTAIGLVTAGFGLGGAAVPLLAMAIQAFGWRNTLVLLGVVVWSIGFPVALLMRHRPEQYGQLPDGDSADPQLPTTSQALLNAQRALDASMRPREVLACPAFWILSTAISLRFAVTSSVTVHQIPFLEDLGFSPTVAAGVLGAIAIISIPARLLFGWLADHFDKRLVMGGALGLMALGMLLMASATSFAQVLVYVPIYGLGYGGVVPLTAAILAEYFGRKNLGTVLGFNNAVTMVGNGAGPLFAGYMFDVSGSYRLAFAAYSGVCLLALALLVTVRRPVQAAGPAEATG